MFYSFLLVYLFQLVHTGADGLVFQSPGLTVDKGTNVTLSCDISLVFGQCSCVRWLLYQPVGGLMIYAHLSTGFTPITKKAQQDKHCLLNIPKANLSDNGTFYCLLLNSGFDYMGNGTELTVMDITDELKVSNEDYMMNLEQGHSAEYQCLFPMAVLGGLSLLLIILTVTLMCIWQRTGIIKHQKNNSASEEHQQSSSEVQYAALRFGTRR
ncbi:hypothetical protein AMEX_G8983 [Astyanax mexicanus]|uniref:Ig-like domain-containing protein n=1 Tax=Astyanax mexicanus TaxID=7994 RepID=A0A8T2M4V2_ASTMX|nr:hypothetical protein AMEX_G8983 [Astyanax mexicanus]